MQNAEAVPFSAAYPRQFQQQRRGETAILFAFAAIMVLLHLFTNGRYGFHRDELQFLSDARHLDWGFVSYPPFTPFIERIGLSVFGLSMVGLRLFPVLAQAIAVVVAALMAREFGGHRSAQIISALATAFSPISLFEGTEFQYTSFDFLWWVLVGYFVLRLIDSQEPRWWLAIGAAIGLGLETKYSIVFLIAGLLIGLAITPMRRSFTNRWFWAGVGVALLLFLPNLIWLVRHNFISYQFLEHIHMRDVAEGRAEHFFRDQFLICTNLAMAPLWIAGFVGLALNRRYRMLAFWAAVPVVLFAIGRGRGYYPAGVYPVMLAMGAVLFERWFSWLPSFTRRTLAALYFVAFAAVSTYVSAVVLPLAASGPLRNFALANNGDLREEVGWNQLVSTVASIRDSLPPDQRARLGITTENYGEYGAIDVLGRAYGLPTPIGTANSEWYRGYPTPAPTTLIVLGLNRDEADSIFSGCRLAGHNGNSEGVKNEESEDHPDIFVCGPPRLSWAELWKRHRDFG